MPEQDMGEEPHDLAYVYAGYAPLSVRLFHSMLSMSATVEEQLRLLPGPYFFFFQPPKRLPSAAGSGPCMPTLPPRTLPPLTPVANAAPATEPPALDGVSSTPLVTLVCFLGGCTFAEIAALRWLGRNSTPRRSYIVMTTHIVNGDTLMESLLTTCDNGLEKLP